MAILSDTRQYLTDRVLEMRSLLMAVPNTPTDPTRPYSIQTKGLFFISLYAMFEHIVTECIQKVLENMNLSLAKKSDIKDIVLSVVLDAEASALSNCGPDKVWQKRINLFSAISSSEVINVSTSILPIPGGNIKYKHIKAIWEVFEIPVVINVNPIMAQKITTVTDHRNAIAHGRQTTEEIGRLYTRNSLEITLNEYDALCESIIDAFEDYIVNQRYIKGN